MKNSQRGSTAIVLLIIVVVILLVVIGWMYFKQPASTVQSISNSSAISNTQLPPVTPTNTNQGQNQSAVSNPNLETYTSTQYGFSFQYPIGYQAQNPDSNLMQLPDKTNVVELYGSPDNILVTYATGSTLDESTGKYGTDKIYFDTTKNQWVRLTAGVSAKNGNQYTDTSVITPSYSSGGLPYFSDDTGVSSSVIIPLSHSSFVIMGISDNSPEDDAVLGNIASTLRLTQ